MSDDLRARIAAVLWQIYAPVMGYADQRWDELSEGLRDEFREDADVLIRELCLHREEMSEWAVLSEGFRGHRYVTHWEENDPAPVTKIRSAEKLGLTGDGE